MSNSIYLPERLPLSILFPIFAMSNSIYQIMELFNSYPVVSHFGCEVSSCDALNSIYTGINCLLFVSGEDGLLTFWFENQVSENPHRLCARQNLIFIHHNLYSCKYLFYLLRYVTFQKRCKDNTFILLLVIFWSIFGHF